MDVDGTLTNGKIYIGQREEVFKAFSCKDGYGITHILKPSGIKPVIITGRVSDIVKNRCKEHGIELLFQGASDKVAVLDDLLKQLGSSLDECAYIGDDMNDYEVMNKIRLNGGITACPCDAVKGIKDICSFISTKEGGNGAVREFIEYITE